MIKSGTVYWITGFAGAGKTTIGEALYERIKPRNHSTVLLDGDAMREAFGNDLGYSEEDRFKCAMRYSRICKLLSDQGIDVICCTISMFNEVRKWNRENIDKYVEVYVKVDHDVLIDRNQKQLYSSETKNVSGVDLKLQTPENPDIILENNGVKSISELVDIILVA